MTDPNVSSRIEAELARTKASIADAAKCETLINEPPARLYRDDPEADETVRANAEALYRFALTWTDEMLALSCCPAFDRATIAKAPAFLAMSHFDQVASQIGQAGAARWQRWVKAGRHPFPKAVGEEGAVLPRGPVAIAKPMPVVVTPADRYGHAVAWGTDGARRQATLNMAIVCRFKRDRAHRGSAIARLWNARLKARQIELLIMRLGRDLDHMRAQGWVDRDPDTRARHPLEVAALDRLTQATVRLNRARDRSDAAYRDHQQSRRIEAEAREAA